MMIPAKVKNIGLKSWGLFRVLLFCLIWANSGTSGLHAAVAEDFEKANQAYAKGEYPQAAELYLKVDNAGMVSPALYFNLGNALFKSGQLGKAIYYYRKAEVKTPRDPDIRANLKFVRKQVHGDDPAPKTWYLAGLNHLNLNEWSLISALLLWGWCTVVVLRVRTDWGRYYLRKVTVFLGLLLMVSVGIDIAKASFLSTPVGIVVSKEASLRSGPLEQAKLEGTLKDGVEVSVMEQRSGWVQVRDLQNRTGWLTTNEVVVLQGW